MTKIKRNKKKRKHSNIPNRVTLKAIKDSENGKNLIRVKDTADMFRKLGI
jgi:antitoxin component of RelBE/YafQ-DinJ toxin-antitoxin module